MMIPIGCVCVARFGRIVQRRCTTPRWRDTRTAPALRLYLSWSVRTDIWGALLTLLGLTDGVNAAPVAELKILSFNIWVNGGRSLSNCIAVIRTAGADIVGLQECNAATAQTIASNLGFYAATDSDASIVSRFRILTNIAASGGRGVTIELAPGQRVHFFNCHLTAYPYGPY